MVFLANELTHLLDQHVQILRNLGGEAYMKIALSALTNSGIVIYHGVPGTLMIFRLLDCAAFRWLRGEGSFIHVVPLDLRMRRILLPRFRD